MELRLGRPLDPTYRAFLRTADGWPLFDFFCDLLPAREVARLVGRADDDLVWRGAAEFVPDINGADLLPIGSATDSAERVFLVTTRGVPWPVLWELPELLDHFGAYFTHRAADMAGHLERLRRLDDGVPATT